MLKGWISIHRKIQDNLIWEDKPFSRGQAWIDLLLLANHEDRQMLFNGSAIQVKRGEKITSLRQLSERWGWSITKVKKFLNLLSDEKMISYKSDSKKTVYNIVNYEVYQDSENTKSNTEITLKENKKKTEINQKETNNKINNYNNVNNNNGVGQSELNLDEPQLAQLIRMYENCGFGLITPYSANMLRDYMNEYSFAWVKEAIEIAEQNGVRTLAYIRGVLNKKKTGVDKPRNNFKKKETYYKPKEQENREVDTSIVDSFMKKIKKEGVTNDKTKQV